MNALATADVGETLLALLLGTSLIVAAAELLARCRSGVAWQRGVWQAALLAGCAVLAAELSGLAPAVSNWRPMAPSPPVVAERDAPESMSADGVSVAVPESPLPEAYDSSSSMAPVFAATLVDAAAEEFVATASESSAESALPLLWILTICGAAALLARLVVGRWLLSRLAAKWDPIDDPAVHDSVRRIAILLGLISPVRTLVAGNLAGPIAFGVWRPTIGLPRHFARDFDARQRQAMLAHEVAHLAGRDPAWHALADFLAACLWWHPATWLMRARWQAACEAAADEASLLFEDGPRTLASCLVAVAKRTARRPAPAWLGIEGGGFRSGLGRRVVRLVALAGRTGRSPVCVRGRTLHWVLAPVLSAGVLMSTAWARPQAETSGENSMSLTTSWKKTLAGAIVLAALSPVATAQEPERKEREGDRPSPERRDGPRESPEARQRDVPRPDGAPDRPREPGADRRAIQERIERLTAEARRVAESNNKEAVERIERQILELKAQLGRLGRGDGDAPRRDGPRDADRPRPDGPPDAPRPPRAPNPPRDGDRPLPSRGPDGEGRGAGGPPGAPQEMMAMLREMRAEMQRLRAEVGELRARVNELSGGRGPDGPRREGDRPDAPRAGEGGRRPVERPVPTRDARPEGDRPREGGRPPEGDRPREGDRPDGDRPK